MSIKNQPYHLLLLSAILFALVAAFATQASDVLDIHLHDTYFVIAHFHAGVLLASVCVVLWVVYLLTGRLMRWKWLTWLHIVLTIASLVCLCAVLFRFNGHNGISARNYIGIGGFKSLGARNDTPDVLAMGIILLLAAQCLFLINLIVGLIHQLSRHNKTA